MATNRNRRDTLKDTNRVGDTPTTVPTLITWPIEWPIEWAGGTVGSRSGRAAERALIRANEAERVAGGGAPFDIRDHDCHGVHHDDCYECNPDLAAAELRYLRIGRMTEPTGFAHDEVVVELFPEGAPPVDRFSVTVTFDGGRVRTTVNAGDEVAR